MHYIQLTYYLIQVDHVFSCDHGRNHQRHPVSVVDYDDDNVQQVGGGPDDPQHLPLLARAQVYTLPGYRTSL